MPNMPETRFTRDQWWSFFYTVDIVVGLVVAGATVVAGWSRIGVPSILLAFLALIAFGYLLPRLFRYEAVRATERKGPSYRRDGYVISAAIIAWVCFLLLTGGVVWILLLLT